MEFRYVIRDVFEDVGGGDARVRKEKVLQFRPEFASIEVTDKGGIFPNVVTKPPEWQDVPVVEPIEETYKGYDV